MGMHPLFGLLHALCSFLAPLLCFWAMMRKILPICYLFDDIGPVLPSIDPFLPSILIFFPFIAGILCNLRLRRKKKYAILLHAFLIH